MFRPKFWLYTVVLLSIALSISACGTSETEDEPMAEMEEMSDDMDMSAMPDELDTSTEKMSDQGTFMVSVSSNLDPLEINEIHTWTIHVETADGEQVEGAEIAVDGGMPEHNHGFPTAPEVTEELGGGDYLLEGMKFNMAGWWELKLAITSGDQADEVTFNITLP